MEFRLPGYVGLVNVEDAITGARSFTWGEVTKDGTRVPPIEAITYAAVHQARKLQELKDALEKKLGRKLTFTVTSWYRRPEDNRRIGGAKGSLHMSGYATDVIISGLTSTEQNAKLIRDTGWEGGIGYYPGPEGGWFHLSSAPVKERGVTFKGK